MDIGPEISNKIRSAIKAKLVELGAYVDEELPDYIMVMVANKKTRLQMTEDLSLFLGSNTDKFTAWLHSLLTKLQSISADTVAETNEDKKSEKVERKKSIEKKTPAEEAQGNKAPVKDLSSKPKTSKPKQVVAQKETPAAEASSVVGAAATPGTSSTSTTSVTTAAPAASTSTSTAPTVEAEEPEFTVRADTDEFSEEQKELEKQAETKKPEQKAAKPAGSSAAAPRTSVTTAPTHPSTHHPPVHHPTTNHPTTHHPPPPRERERVREKYSVSSLGSRLGEKRVVTRSDERCIVPAEKSARRTAVLSSSHVSLKRRAPSSVVTPVSNSRVEEEEEEYDPHNPSVGNVASVVRVTARKSSVPRSLQANKALLMKAMTDAEKSVTGPAGKRSVAVAGANPDRVIGRSLYSDIISRVSSGNTNVGVGRVTIAAGGRYPVLQTAKPAPNSLQSGLTSRSRKTEIMRKMKYTIDVEAPDYPDEETGSDSDVVRDNRVVEVDPEEEEAAASPEVVVAVSDSDGGEVEEEVVLEEGDREGADTEEGEVIPLILDETGDEFTRTLEEEVTLPDTAAHRLRARGDGDMDTDSGRIVKENPKNTKFIVTLDGVDPDQYDNVEMEEVEKSDRAPPDLALISTPRVQPFNINLKDSDDEDDAEITPLKKAKMAEKCRFWPACVNGNSCEYHHPTVPCKTFPSCKFGDKCLYIHPNCKYDARCTKSDCPFTHASKRKPVPVSPPQVIAIPQPKVIVAAPPIVPPSSHPRQVTCRFYPNCHNMKCPFKHPKPCRYGLSCAKKAGCPFFHPALPTKDKLTWKSSKGGQGSDGIKAS